ncbi:NAD(P)/FAD-dependent oxidoreductase [Aeromicrobium sp. CF3.5]|uniref:NAD(P)/FAD-dependent oxidoreductase n=1 Tax=Aeromicrobium sp. CF3.5 TaxID=3373078 RepID=UPI003EE5E6C6
MRHDYDYLIIGAGMTADAAARGIREIDPAGSIGIVGDESDPPVRRPALSKDLWIDDDATLTGSTLDPAADTGAEVFLGQRITGLDPQGKVATSATGDEFGYGRALIATGGTPRHLDGLEPSEHVIYYRTVADYRRLREAAQPDTHAVVVGGGYIGSEIAAALSQNDVHVTMVFPEDAPGAGRFPTEIAEQVTARYGQAGVQLRAGTGVDSGHDTAEGVQLTLDDGSTLDADLVVVGLGLQPAGDLAESAGIDRSDDGGIVVDDHLRTSVDDVFAAGDVASYLDPRLGRRRVEHEDNATTMGQAAGRALAGADEKYAHTPMFYSDLFDLGYEAVGRMDPSLETDVVEQDGGSVVYYLDDGRVVGVLLWNVWNAVDAAKSVIESGTRPESGLLKS